MESRLTHADLLQRVGLKDVTEKQEFTVSSREEMGRCTCAFEIAVLNVSHAIEINDVLPSRGHSRQICRWKEKNATCV